MNSFIWRGNHKRLALPQQYGKIFEGGLGLTQVRAKCNSLIIKNTIAYIIGRRTPTDSTTYLLGPALSHLITENKARKEKPNAIFTRTIQEVRKMESHNEEIDWRTASARNIYEMIIAKVIEKPAIEIKNPGKNYSKIYRNINNKFILPEEKEHLVKRVHDILPTRARLKRCGYSSNDRCRLCGQKETAIHISLCETSQPTLKWTKRKINKITNQLKDLPDENLVTMDFYIDNVKERNTVHRRLKV